jgi:mono/diheme cytochrome c family protein
VLNWTVVGALVAVLVVLRLLRAGMLVWVVAWGVGLYVFFTYGIATPIPSAALRMYMAISALSLYAYVTSSPERAAATWTPIHRFLTERRYTAFLLLAVVALPCLAAWSAYANLNVPVQPPFFGRTVHPSPPGTITVHDQTIDLVRGENPMATLERADPNAFKQHVARGKAVYYSNCFFCHGDGLGGDGMFAHGLNPVPANFKDSGVLPNFMATFFFWRIAKGGPGMPDEGAPGDSAMPEWERFLSNEDVWDVIAFLYDDTGYRPRTFEEISAK